MLLILAMLLFWGSIAIGQSAEYYYGEKRSGLDVMWFRNFKFKEDEKSPLLFFNRNRVSVDDKGSTLVFGSVNAISYNLENGFGGVFVASYLINGFYPKAGVQYFNSKNSFMFFGWLVADLKNSGNYDLFGLFRFQPRFNENFSGFAQLELFPSYNEVTNIWNFTQRLRLGVKYQYWAFGFMADANQIGKQTFKTTENIGFFLRHEF